ncbi:MAG: ATP-binding protein [Acidobacteriota bacterium]|nr:ATP-binding protein [Acidobacteriota bacterium]
MPARPKAWISWSSGKDSALALHHARTAGELDVVGLLTTVNAEFERVAMHGVRRALLEAQAAALDLPLHVVELPWPCANEVYEQLMGGAVAEAAAAGVEAMIFGDLFLEDVRRYRERALAGSGVAPLFPLWQRPTDDVARELLELGVRALLSCVDPAQAPAALAGRWYDEALLSALPAGVDPCGENGEFHTVVVDGPGFGSAIPVTVGASVERDGFVFTDVALERG